MKMEETRRHKALQNAAHHIALECIHPQSAHGSPYHVYPYPSPVRLQHAFQNNAQANNASPKMFYPKGLKSHFDSKSYSTPSDSPILGRALCLTPRGSPLPGRVTHLSEKFSDSLTLHSDTDILVAKIGAMFPTVSETHIKILLKKYHNREAVVISALQVEKHPITTPGPISSSPSSVRLLKGSSSQLARTSSVHDSNHLTPQSGTPQGSPSLLRPSSGASSYYGTTRSIDGFNTKPQSPKMKLKYLKSIFSKAEETLILDVLASKDNNVLQASEELITMGFSKKTPISSSTQQEKKGKPQLPKKHVTIPKTMEEKEKLKKSLKKKYSSIAERVVSIALESVDYNDERAEQILDAVLQEEEKSKSISKSSPITLTKSPPKSCEPVAAPVDREKAKEVNTVTAAQPAAAALRRIKAWTDHLRPIFQPNKLVASKYKSNLMSPPMGPNPDICKGPKDNLLLEEYLTWNGPNPEYRRSQRVTSEGPEKRQPAGTIARGPAPGLAKGPAGLAKGSSYKSTPKTFSSFHTKFFKY